MKHKRKLYYPVGLLSLSILLFLFIINLLNDHRAYAKNVIEVNVFNENYRNSLKRWKKDYNWDIDIPPHGSWNVFTFTNDEKVNKRIFDSLHVATTQFMLNRDTLRGIEILLNSKMSFNRFVLILDMFELEKIDRYVIDSSIWIPRFSRYRKPINNNSKSFICGGVIYPPDPDVIELGRLDMVFVKWWFFCRDEMQKIPLPIMLAWLGLFSLNIVRLVKWRKVK